jgi:hypothetical protein
MSNTVNKLKSYYSLRPSQYGYLEAFKLEREIHDGSCSDYSLKLKLCPSTGQHKNKRLTISFSEVKELKVGDLKGLVSLLIDIRDVQEFQLEDTKYKVVENEYEAFSFYCNDFQFDVN